MPVWLPQVLTLVGVIIAGLSTVWGSHLVSKRNAKAADKTAQATIQEAINEGFTTLMSEFHQQMNDAKKEIIELRGWIRDLIQHIESLETMLRAQDVAVPPRRHHPHLLSIAKRPEDTGRG